MMNYLNFDVTNFNVEEKGSLRHVVERAKETYEIQDEEGKDSNLEL
jgi:hypothetical protein